MYKKSPKVTHITPDMCKKSPKVIHIATDVCIKTPERTHIAPDETKASSDGGDEARTTCYSIL